MTITLNFNESLGKPIKFTGYRMSKLMNISLEVFAISSHQQTNSLDILNIYSVGDIHRGFLPRFLVIDPLII